MIWLFVFRRHHGEISAIPLCVHHPHWMSHMIRNAICNHTIRIYKFIIITFAWHPLLLYCGASSVLVSMKKMWCELFLILTMRQVHGGAELIYIMWQSEVWRLRTYTHFIRTVKQRNKERGKNLNALSLTQYCRVSAVPILYTHLYMESARFWEAYNGIIINYFNFIRKYWNWLLLSEFLV